VPLDHLPFGGGFTAARQFAMRSDLFGEPEDSG
jgi:hypothetical protein